MTAQEYWEKEGCRLLLEYTNQVPSIEDRVKAAFQAGFAEGVEHSLSFESPVNPHREIGCYVREENT
jgi:hypothetical protein